MLKDKASVQRKFGSRGYRMVGLALLTFNISSLAGAGVIVDTPTGDNCIQTNLSKFPGFFRKLLAETNLIFKDSDSLNQWAACYTPQRNYSGEENSYLTTYKEAIDIAASEFNLPPAYLTCILSIESRFNYRACPGGVLGDRENISPNEIPKQNLANLTIRKIPLRNPRKRPNCNPDSALGLAQITKDNADYLNNMIHGEKEVDKSNPQHDADEFIQKNRFGFQETDLRGEKLEAFRKKYEEIKRKVNDGLDPKSIDGLVESMGGRKQYYEYLADHLEIYSEIKCTDSPTTDGRCKDIDDQVETLRAQLAIDRLMDQIRIPIARFTARAIDGHDPSLDESIQPMTFNTNTNELSKDDRSDPIKSIGASATEHALALHEMQNLVSAGAANESEMKVDEYFLVAGFSYNFGRFGTLSALEAHSLPTSEWFSFLNNPKNNAAICGKSYRESECEKKLEEARTYMLRLKHCMEPKNFCFPVDLEATSFEQIQQNPDCPIQGVENAC